MEANDSAGPTASMAAASTRRLRVRERLGPPTAPERPTGSGCLCFVRRE